MKGNIPIRRFFGQANWNGTTWANEEAKMAKIIRHVYVTANNSIFRSIMQYFSARSIALKECYL